MEKETLFIGFLLDPLFEKELKKVLPDIKSLYIKEDEEGLQEKIMGSSCYLGKNVGEIFDLNQIETIEAHLLSYLKKLVPEEHYSYGEIKFVIF